MQTWINFKAHFAAAYARVQEYQHTASQANFHGAHNMTGDIGQKTNASQEELHQFLANIAAEYLTPPPQNAQNSALQSHVDTPQNQLTAMQAQFNSL